jgi:quinol monooxygenase YgiN
MGGFLTGRMSSKFKRIFALRNLYLSTTLTSCVVAFLLIAASGLALAADQTTKPAENSNPCNVSKEDAAALNPDFGTDVRAMRKYETAAARILREEKFEELDCLADAVRSGKERFPGGQWKIALMYEGWASPAQYPVHATREDWETLMQRLQKWETARPKSVTARVATASAYIGYAWYARGNGMGDTVSDNGWSLFRDRLAEARRILDEAAALPSKCPEWYNAMEHVGMGQGWSIAAMRSLYDEAIKFEPGYYYNARVFATYLLPQWAGKPGDTERFMQEAADRVGGERGDELYFQMATLVVCGCVDDPHLSLERIERGFEANEKLFGTSILNLNRIAYVTSNYGDRDPVFADKVLTRIGDQWDAEKWDDQEAFDAAKQWASYTAPMEAGAQAGMRTPEGVRYNVTFEKAYREMLQQCVSSDGGAVNQSQGKFTAITRVTANGAFDFGGIASRGPVVVCMYRKFHASHENGSPLFPPPPQAPFWVKLNLDWADFSPVATK